MSETIAVAELLLNIIKAFGTIGDSVSKLMEIFFQHLGISVPAWGIRILTIAVEVLLFWRFASEMGTVTKFVVALVILGSVMWLFGLSYFA